MAVVQLGGHPVYTRGDEVGFDTREPVEDVDADPAGLPRASSRPGCSTTDVLERMVDVADVPVVNLLSDRAAPAAGARRRADDGAGRSARSPAGRVAWVGDYNNVARSLGRDLRCCSAPTCASPARSATSADDAELERLAAARCGVGVEPHRPAEAVAGADAVHADTWVSMGQEDEQAGAQAGVRGLHRRRRADGPRPRRTAVFLHCLPAYRGLEVTADVIDGPRSVVFQQGHNRLHAARAALAFLLRASTQPVSLKQQRQQAIARLIGQQPVANQPQLLELLGAEGITATQATVSRDLEELGRDQGARAGRAVASTPCPSWRPTASRRSTSCAGCWGSGSARSPRRPTSSCCARRPAAPTSSPRRSTAAGSTACSAPSPATTRCCASPPRPRPATSSPTGCARSSPGSGDDDALTTAERHTLWHGRFAGGPADALLAYTVSLPFDRRLWRDDIAGSRAHVGGLQRAGLLDDDERRRHPRRARRRSSTSWPPDTFEFAPSDEDIHTAVERRVTELAGAAGAKLHTARSRNDQVATDLRLWCKRELRRRRPPASSTCRTSCSARAEAAGDAYLPGYTHLQRAQPVLLAHHLLAHGWALARDVDRLRRHRRAARRVAARRRRAGRARRCRSTRRRRPPALGFADVFANSLDAVSDRDFVAEALFDLALVGIHLARIGEEWVLWTSEEFGFARLDDAYATGSSMLPQKKNPDIAELARGKAGRLIGNLTGLLATLKGLPLAYNRDLQEDKEPLFDSVDQVVAGARRDRPA